MTKEELELEKARHQFIGFGHAQKGYGVEELMDAMGLTRAEYAAIREDIKSHLTVRDLVDADDWINAQEVK